MPPGYSTHPNGCMPNATWSNLMVGFPLANWPSGSVPTLAVPMNLILSFPKRSREYALGVFSGRRCSSITLRYWWHRCSVGYDN
jgi:hypothetical protein